MVGGEDGMTLRVVAFKIDKYLLELLDFYAINHGMYRSEVIRFAIQKLLEEDQKAKGRGSTRTNVSSSIKF
jgi:metal-responsive CopG/Arc/MetJ family transcriptional regulator